MSEVSSTPEFLAWTLAFDCPLRAGSDVHSPEKTERQLRALRAAGEGIVEGCVHQGVCLSRGNRQFGFRLEDALSVYGGLPLAEETCGACTANVAKAVGTSALAGCYGVLPRTVDEGADWARLLEKAIGRLGLSALVAEYFTVTTPVWYGLWMNSPLGRESLNLLGQLWSECLTIAGGISPDAVLFGEAIHRAKETSISLQVELHPPGWYEAEDSWIVAANCPRCRSVWEKRSPNCATCGWRGHHIGERRRKRRGERPYRRLSEFLSPEEVEKISRSDESRLARE